MTSLTAISLSDIKFFLTLNNRSISVDDIYSEAWDLIISGTITSAPPSVTDWIISYNLLHQKINIPIYKTSEILLSPDKEVKDLANLLTLPNVDKESIIRILGYLNVLNNDIDIFETLPQEILINIIKELDCKSILLICKSSKQFNKFCELKLDTLLKQKLHKETKFITDTYNREELIRLCRLYKTKHISAGGYHSLVLKDDQVYSFGDGYNGQLGLADLDIFEVLGTEVNNPTLITNLQNITQISTGTYNSWALNANGQVYAWGDNEHGQLGLGNYTNIFYPTLVSGLEDIIQISSNEALSYALNDKGQIYAFGSNDLNQFGSNFEMNTPSLIPELDNIKQISVGSYHTLALTNDGKVYSFGSNTHGQLGLGDFDDRNIPSLIAEINNVIHISSGLAHSVSLMNDGHTYSFGINEFGQLGLGDYDDGNIPILIANLHNIIQISAGNGYSLALTNTGKIYSFGDNNVGELGLEHNIDTNIPTLILKIPNNIIQISCGERSSLVLTNNGEIFAFGNNEYGQLGLGDTKDRNIPTLIPNFNVLS